MSPRLLLLALLVPTTASAATIRVCGSCTHTTVQSALDVARAGDLIDIAAGTYTGEIEVDVAVTIQGAGSGRTTLAADSTSVVVLEADATLLDLAIAPTRGRSVHVRGVEAVLRRLDLSGGTLTDDDGAGVLVDRRSDVTIDACTFSDNRALGGLGGHVAGDGADVTITDSSFDGGVAERGGSIAVVEGFLTLTDSTLSAGTAERRVGLPYGGHVYLDDVTATLDGATLEQGASDVGYGGAIAAVGGTDLELVDTDLSDNDALYYGGGIYQWGGALTLRRGVVSGNVARHVSAGSGAGVWVRDVDLAVVDTTFEDNDAGASGGGLAALLPASVSIVGATLEGNRARVYGGGMYAFTRVDWTLEDATFVDNTAYAGAGLWFQDNTRAVGAAITRTVFEANRATSTGGGLYAYLVGTLDLDEVEIRDNVAVGAGGLMTNGVETLTLDDSDVIGNEAGYAGGLYLYQVGDLAIRGSRVALNEATSSYAGGVLLVTRRDGATAAIERTAFVENVARTDSGAIRVDHRGTGSAAVLDHLVFAGNAASTAGSAIRHVAGLQTLTNSIFVDQGTRRPFDGPEGDVTIRWNLDHRNPGRVPGEDVVRGDPGFRAWSDDGDLSNDDFHTACDANGIDQGDPDAPDPDGTAADLGLYGGPDADPALFRDTDGDGFEGLCDCLDSNADVYPGAEEIPYDGLDNDCLDGDACDLDRDGVDSEACEGGTDCDDEDDRTYPGAPDTWYDGVDSDCAGDDDFDQDADGFQRGPEGEDCDDTDPDRYPGAPETCDDLVDYNCDGSLGNDDLDGDGVRACDDCDDQDPGAAPGLEEIPYDGVDNDCEGGDLTDVDADGFDAAEVDGPDCNDADPSVHPDRPEIAYDGRDNDCAGGDLVDVDGDGFDAAFVGGTDCNDADATIHPEAEDVRGDGIDQDCDGIDPDEIRLVGAGCGCAASASPLAPWWSLPGLLLLLRRRRR